QDPADRGGDERARPPLRRRGVPQRVKDTGRRRRPKTDPVGGQQHDPVAEKRRDHGRKGESARGGRRLEEKRERNERRPSDRRPERPEQERDADKGAEKAPLRDRNRHCASAFEADRLSAVIRMKKQRRATFIADASPSKQRAAIWRNARHRSANPLRNPRLSCR